MNKLLLGLALALVGCGPEGEDPDLGSPPDCIGAREGIARSADLFGLGRCERPEDRRQCLPKDYRNSGDPGNNPSHQGWVHAECKDREVRDCVNRYMSTQLIQCHNCIHFDGLDLEEVINAVVLYCSIPNN